MKKEADKKQKYEFEYCCKTDIGKKRNRNDDSVGYYVPQNEEIRKTLGSLFVVADGVGGNSNGHIASKLAVKTIIRTYYSTSSKGTIQERLNYSIKAAHSAIYENSIELNTPSMATTVVVAAVFSDYVLFANVGDSRAYVVGPNRENGIEQITVDHTVIEEQLEKGLISEKEARLAKNKNVITNALGNSKNVKIDFFKVALLDQDKILITTDGLTHVINDRRIYQIISESDIETSAKRLIGEANSRGGPDNISLCLISKRVPKPKPKPNYKNIAIFLTVLVLLVGGILAWSHLFSKIAIIQTSVFGEDAKINLKELTLTLTPIKEDQPDVPHEVNIDVAGKDIITIFQKDFGFFSNLDRKAVYAWTCTANGKPYEDKQDKQDKLPIYIAKMPTYVEKGFQDIELTVDNSDPKEIQVTLSPEIINTLPESSKPLSISWFPCDHPAFQEYKVVITREKLDKTTSSSLTSFEPLKWEEQETDKNTYVQLTQDPQNLSKTQLDLPSPFFEQGWDYCFRVDVVFTNGNIQENPTLIRITYPATKENGGTNENGGEGEENGKNLNKEHDKEKNSSSENGSGNTQTSSEGQKDGIHTATQPIVLPHPSITYPANNTTIERYPITISWNSNLDSIDKEKHPTGEDYTVLVKIYYQANELLSKNVKGNETTCSITKKDFSTTPLKNGQTYTCTVQLISLKTEKFEDSPKSNTISFTFQSPLKEKKVELISPAPNHVFPFPLEEITFEWTCPKYSKCTLIVRDQENRDFYNGDIPKENHTNLSDSTVEYTFTLNKDNLVKPFQPGRYTWKINARNGENTLSKKSSFTIEGDAPSYNKNSIIHNYSSRFHCFYRLPFILLRSVLNNYFPLAIL